MHTYVNGCYNLQMGSVSPPCMCTVCSFFLCLSLPLPTVLTSIRSRVHLGHCLVPALYLGCLLIWAYMGLCVYRCLCFCRGLPGSYPPWGFLMVDNAWCQLSWSGNTPPLPNPIQHSEPAAHYSCCQQHLGLREADWLELITEEKPETSGHVVICTQFSFTCNPNYLWFILCWIYMTPILG